MRPLTFVVVHLFLIVSAFILAIALNDKIKTVSNDYSGAVSFLSWCFGVFSFTAGVLYVRSFKYRLSVDRLSLKFRRVHTFWTAAFLYELEADDPQRQLDILNQAMESIERRRLGSFKRRNKTNSTAEFSIDERFYFAARITENRLHVALDRSIAVPSQLYQQYATTLSEVAGAILQGVAPVAASRFTVQVMFRDGVPNPYYGYFVSHVPSDQLRHFEVTYSLKPSSTCQIQAHTEGVSVDGESIVEVFQGLSDVVSLKGNVTGAAA